MERIQPRELQAKRYGSRSGDTMGQWLTFTESGPANCLQLMVRLLAIEIGVMRSRLVPKMIKPSEVHWLLDQAVDFIAGRNRMVKLFRTRLLTEIADTNPRKL